MGPPWPVALDWQRCATSRWPFRRRNSVTAKYGSGLFPLLFQLFYCVKWEKHARDLLLTGKLINADEALRIALINEVVPPEKLMARTTKLAEQLAANSPASLVATKRLLRDLMGAEVDAQLRLSVKENAAIRATDDFREGISSFLEKRTPKWSGK